MIKRTVIVTHNDPQEFNTAVNATVIDTQDRKDTVLTIMFSTNCEQGVTTYNALILIGDGQ